MSLRHFVAILLLTLCSLVNTQYTLTENIEKQLLENCNNSHLTNCVKLNIVSWIDQLNENDSYSIYPGVTIVKEDTQDAPTTVSIVKELARDFPDDREARLNAFLVKKISAYLDTHSLKLNFWSDRDEVESARRGGGAGGGSGKNKGFGHLLAAAAMVKGVLLFIALKSLAIIAGKALTTSLISLLLSIIVGLVTLRRGGLLTYEVVPKPMYTHSQSITHSAATPEEYAHHVGHTGYGRSIDVPLPLGLRPEYHP